jgi:4-amino-4-deoxy-L-arabinose transferase-like glycosyltransferase
VTASRAGWCLTVAALAIYLGLVIAQLDRPLMYDDANFALAARAVAETGLPFGNQGWMSERGDFSQQQQWALWHPPLYVYLLGLATRVGGWTPPVLRSVAIIGGLATAALTFRLAADLTPGHAGLRCLSAGVAVAGVVLDPLAVQSTLVLDIDFALLLPLTLLLIWLYLRWHATSRRWLWLIPVFALTLWAKMTNPLAVIAAVGLWQAVRPRPLPALAQLACIALGGALLFGATWFAIGSWLGFPLDMPFSVNLVQWQDSSEIARRAYASPGAFIEGLQPTILWLGPGLTALGLFALAVRGGQLATCFRIRHVDLLIGLMITLVLGYVNKDAGWFPKYQVVFAPLLACVAAPLVATALCSRPRMVSGALCAATLGAIAITAGQVRDSWALHRTWAIAATPAKEYLLVMLCGAAIGLYWRRPAATILGVLAGVAIGWSLAVDGVQVGAAYQTDYWYGTTGTAQAAAWLDAHLQPGQVYVAAKEVAIRARNPSYVDQENIFFMLSVGHPFTGTWAGQAVAALVLWEREPFVRQLVERGVPPAGYVESARFGDYVIYAPGS